MRHLLSVFGRAVSSSILRRNDAGQGSRGRAIAARARGAAALMLGLVAGAATAAQIDLSVSSYTQTPDPVPRSAAVSFTAIVTNNDSSQDATGAIALAIALPANVDFAAASAPAGCSFAPSAAPTALNCSRTGLAAMATWQIAFSGVGKTAGAVTSSATVSFTSGDTDNNSGNDALVKNTTVVNGADLAIQASGASGMTSACTSSCTAPAGASVTFALDVGNVGPDPAALFRVTANLPAATDFSYTSATGAGWTCGASGTVLTCDYHGASVANGQHAPLITLGGKLVKALAGTITLGASVATSDASTGDPQAANNGPSQVVVTVTPGTDLVAHQSLVSNGTGQTVFVVGDAVTLTLSANNTGTQDASGVTLSDTLPAGLAIVSLPSGCSASGQAIVCSVGALAHGAASATYTIPLTVAAGAVSGTSIVDVARAAPAAGANTPAAVSYTISAPYAHLTLTKAKGPALVGPGGTVTSTIVVTNSSASTSAATGTVRVTDTLSASEIFVSGGGGGWSCGVAGTPQVVSCDYAISGSLARGAALPALTILTQPAAGYSGTLTNSACTGLTAGSPHTPADNSTTGNCANASVSSTLLSANLALQKTSSVATLPYNGNSFSYTLTVTNAGPDMAPTVTVTDPLPSWYSGGAGTTGGSATLDSTGGGESCTFNSTVTCTLRNLAMGASRSVTITVNRPMKDGTFTNTARVASQDAVDADPSDNVASAIVTIDPLADVAVTAMAAAPNPVQVGVTLSYTTSIKNNGPSSATGVLLRQRIDPARMGYVAGSAAIAGSAASCTWVASFSGAPYAGQSGVECSGFTLANGEARQLVFAVIPVYPYPDALDATYTSVATITTAVNESDSGNNSGSADVKVTSAALDLTVTDADTGYDPSGFGDSLVYQVKVQNNGPSQATRFKLTVTPVAPPQGGAAAPYTMAWNSAGSTLPAGASCSQPGGLGADLTCYLSSSLTGSVLASGSHQTFALKFDTGPTSNAPAGSVTYKTSVAVESYETGAAPFAGDSVAANNLVAETTTVLPKTDLAMLSKTVSAGSPFGLNQPFTYTLVVANLGPSLASSVKVGDVLPAGLVLTGAPSAALGSGTLATNSCGSGGSAPVTISCTLGTLPVASGSTDTANLVTITIPVKAAYASYSGPFASNVSNTATVAPTPGTTRDSFPGNDSASAVMQIVKASIAGSVYNDANRNNALDSGEKITSAVTVALYGKDFWGNDIGTAAAPVSVGTTAGDFLFDGLPRAGAAGYTIVETQPANYADRFETAGTAGGSVPPAVCDGAQNCAAGAAQNSIGQIVLGQGVQATGYLFQEYAYATISGYVYADLNNDGQRGAGETGIAGVQLKISGTTYAGADLCTLLGAGCGVTTNASGQYTFSVPPGAAGASYTVSEQSLPAGYFDGKDQNGSGNVIAASAGRGAPEAIVVGQVDPGASYTERDFGELPAGSIAGAVFIDGNGDAVRQGTETGGVPGVTVTLAGNDYLGAPVCPSAAIPSCALQTNGSGAYLIAGLPPSDAAGYSVSEGTAAGLTHIGAQAGSLGGVIGGAARAAGAGVVGAAVKAASGIVLGAGVNATGYNFGEQGQGISGFVYADLNRDGLKGAGEPGIAGVTVTLSGNTISGVNVCGVLAANACTAVTGADGGYSFIAIPQSDAAGYTLTETQPAAYIDGAESLGSISGAGGANGAVSGPSPTRDQFSGLVLPIGGFGTNYNFGEWAGSIGGSVYLDLDGSGSNSAGDTPLSGVTITLGGAASATAVTDAAGNYHFDGLAPGTYTLTETQPANYADAVTTAGSAGGSVASGTSITGLTLVAGAPATGYQFGEKGGAISGSVYIDLNDNGVRDAAETRGIAGVTLTLSGVAADGVTTISRQTTTQADGSYSYSGLPSANAAGYSLTESQPNFPDGKQRKGLVNGASSCANPQCDISVANVISHIPFDAAKNYTLFDFGELLGSSIGGAVYVDVNDNGARDSGEAAIAGVRLTLTDGAALVRTATSAADGSYLFEGLPAGTYKLIETQPANYLDGRESAGSAGGTVDNSGFDATAAHNSIAAIVLPASSSATGYLFGERYANGSVAGHVYVDTNHDGLLDNGESGIAGVTLKLSGTAADGSVVNLSATSAADGGYSFAAVPSSGAAGYALTEIQPAAYNDGLTTLTLNANGKPSTAKPTGAGNNDTIAGIKLNAGDQLDGFLFGENGVPSLKTPIISGYVWLDRNHSRERPLDGSQTGLAGWSVQLRQGDKLVCTDSTDEKGFYIFDNLHCAGYEDSGLPTGGGFSVTFQKDGNNMPNVPVSTGGAGVVVPGISRIADITLNAGAAVVEQNLPLDPAGVVYDALTRKPVQGASVSISGPAGFNAALHLVGGGAAQTQVVGSDGMYQFLLQNAFPSGVYTLSVVAPAAYLPAPSSSLPACGGTLSVGLLPNPALVQSSDGAPGLGVKQQLDPGGCVGIVAGGAATTQYYYSFFIANGGSAPILNNHIPLDPLGVNAILVSKTTPMVNVARGDLVPYTITATNTQSVAVGAVLLRDQIPPGFKFRSGSAMRNGVAFAPQVDGRMLTWRETGFAAKEKKTYTMMLMVGSGVGDGEYTNQAWVDATANGPRVSNLATATVRVAPDPTFDCPDIIGKVFDDRNANGYQDQGEPGIPGVRLATTRGLLVTTDAEGRFHVACPDIPNADRGSNFVMKLDERTLPSGYRVTTENPRDVRITRGKVTKLNFGATVHRVVRIELSDAAFEPQSAQLLAQWQGRIDSLMEQLRARPSIVRLAYLTGSDPGELARQRTAALEREIRRRWQELKGEYTLEIEIEGSK